MKKKSFCKKGTMILVSSLLIGATLLSGCGDNSNSASGNAASENVVTNTLGEAIAPDSANQVIMTIEDTDVTMQDVYLYTLQYAFNNSLTPENVNDSTFEGLLNNIMTELKLEVVEYHLALVMESEVTEEILQNAQASADAFYNYFGSEFLGKYGIDQAAVNELFRRQAYIGMMTKEAQINLSEELYEQYVEDYADYEFHKIYYVLFPNYEVDEDGNAVSVNEATLAQNLETANEMWERATEAMENGDTSVTLETLVAEYGMEEYATEDYIYNTNYGEELNQALEIIQDGEISDVIETDAGYMIFRMDIRNDQGYKEYFLNYLAAQEANNNLPVMQQAWYQQSGVASIPVNNDILYTLDMLSIVTDLQAYKNN